MGEIVCLSELFSNETNLAVKENSNSVHSFSRSKGHITWYSGRGRYWVEPGTCKNFNEET